MINNGGGIIYFILARWRAVGRDSGFSANGKIGAEGLVHVGAGVLPRFWAI
jgi:hypothetical protein